MLLPDVSTAAFNQCPGDTTNGIWVISTKMKNTVVVEYTIVRSHPLYKKILRKTKRLKAHTDKTLKVGDKVVVISSRPISKEKHYKVL